jgi:hypothetical protein
MSRPTFGQKIGLVFALVVFAFAVSATGALGWYQQESGTDKGTSCNCTCKCDKGKPAKGDDKEHAKKNDSEDSDHANKGEGEDKDHGNKDDEDKDKDHGNKDDEDKDKDHGNKDDEDKDNGEQKPTAAPPAESGAPPAPPVAAQGAPPSAPPVSTGAIPGEGEELAGEEGLGGSETTPSGKAPKLKTVAQRKRLASTGLDPGLIAVLGAVSLIGGALLFRRSLARN